MLTLVSPEQQAGYRRLLRCPACSAPYGETIEGGVRRVYQCTPGCRPDPIDAVWLDDQIYRALAGKIRLQDACQVLDAIVVASATPRGVRLVWTRKFPLRLQPTITTPPNTVFVPAGRTS